MAKTCPICGEPTNCYMGNYRKDGLCRDHAREFKDGKIYLCDKCGKWHKTGENCKPEKPQQQTKESTYYRPGHCILCNEETENGYLFCRSCYAKYSTRTITVNIKNCQSFTIVDEYGNKKYRTQNGVYVRSQQEMIIYDAIYNKRIRIEYEKIVPYIDDNGEQKELKPDFYLPDYNLYIEHWGYEAKSDPEYKKSKEYKMKVYEKRGLKVASTYNEDIDDIQAALEKIFLKFNINV